MYWSSGRRLVEKIFSLRRPLSSWKVRVKQWFDWSIWNIRVLKNIHIHVFFWLTFRMYFAVQWKWHWYSMRIIKQNRSTEGFSKIYLILNLGIGPLLYSFISKASLIVGHMRSKTRQYKLNQFEYVFKALLNSDHVTPIPFGHVAIVLTSCYSRASSPLPRRPEKFTMTSWNMRRFPAEYNLRSTKHAVFTVFLNEI